jgi:hypothetical protein
MLHAAAACCCCRCVARDRAPRWLLHIKTLLSSAAAVARSLHDGHAALVHCSHGWDRTPQVCALAEVLLDGYYRTVEGCSLGAGGGSLWCRITARLSFSFYNRPM